METTSPASDPLTLAQRTLDCDEGTAIDHDQRKVIIVCNEHSSDAWPCPEAETLAATLREREDRATRRYREREKYFAQLFKVADAGQYRADWDAAVRRWMDEQQELGAQQAVGAVRKLADELVARGHGHVVGCVGQADCAACIRQDLTDLADRLGREQR